MAATGFAGALTGQCQLLCRCSAGNFGIATRFKVATVAVPAQVTVITAIWGFSAAVKAIQWYNVRATCTAPSYCTSGHASVSASVDVMVSRALVRLHAGQIPSSA